MINMVMILMIIIDHDNYDINDQDNSYDGGNRDDVGLM